MSQTFAGDNARLMYSALDGQPAEHSRVLELRKLYSVRARKCMILLIFSLLALAGSNAAMGLEIGFRLELPPHDQKGNVSVEEALQQRRSVRVYEPGHLDLADVSQILWSAQGITTLPGRRTAPSAGALYPLEIFLVAGEVVDLPAGVYRYQPKGHELILEQTGDQRASLASAALSQTFIQEAPAVLVITGIYQRTEKKYGQRSRRYVHMEVGHAAQNVYLQAAARGLATVMVGAFKDSRVQEILGLPLDHMPLGIMPLGNAPSSTASE